MAKVITRNEPCEVDKSIAKSLSNINSNMNFAGFTKRFVGNVVSESEKGLTDKQREMMLLIFAKYRRQIPNFATLCSCLNEAGRKVVADYLKTLKTK